MKRYIYSFALILAIGLCSSNFAGGTNPVTTKITDITVYLQNAKITRIGRAKVPQGTSELIIDDLSSKVLKNSIQVSMGGDVKLLSATYRINYLKDKGRSKEIKMLEDSLDLLIYEISWIRDQKTVCNEEVNVILANNKLGSEQQGFTVTELQQLTEFYGKKLKEIKKKILDLGKTEKNLKLKKSRIQNQLNELKVKKINPTGEIVLEVTGVKSEDVKIECSYLITGAGWTPLYDLRSKGTEEPITFTYKANIYQNSGYDWKNIQLTVSTANPSVDNSRPILYPRYVDYYIAPPPMRYGSKGKMQMMQVQAAQNMATVDMKREADESIVEDKPEVYGVVNENQMSVDFEVKDVHNIPSDGKEHLVALTDVTLEAEYDYHTVPNLDKGAFLLAKVANWGRLNLIPGYANIFFEDTYIGQSYINPYTTADTLLLSMGRDESIKVKRIKIQELTSTKYIGVNKKETIAYEISVRNTKSQNITIEILDQIPISKQKDIEVKLEEYEGAAYVEKFGKLLWTLDIKPNETKKVSFVYTVKYPKDKVLKGI